MFRTAVTVIRYPARFRTPRWQITGDIVPGGVAFHHYDFFFFVLGAKSLMKKKPTNKQLYVHASSYHPPSILAAISKGETHRYLRTNSDENNFEKMTLNLVHRLKHRGYRQNQILKHVQEVKFNQRPESLIKRKQKEPKLVFTTNYCDDIRRIKCALKKHWKLIEQNETLREIFPQPPVIAFKANPSLRHKLVRAKLKPLDDPPQPIPHQPNDEPKELPDQYPHTILNILRARKLLIYEEGGDKDCQYQSLISSFF